MHDTATELDDCANLFKQKSGESGWKWILRLWDNGGRNIKVEQAEFIDMGLLGEESRFNMEACTVKKRCQKLV